MTPNQALKQLLADYKHHAAQVNNGTYKRCIGPIHETPISWKQARQEWPLFESRPAALKKAAFTRALSDDKTKLFIDSFEQLPGFVSVEKAHEISPRIARGWYCDTLNDGTISGAVITIRHPQKLNPDNSHYFYLAGTYSNDFDGVMIYTGKIFDCQFRAAHYADDLARIEAEKSKELDIVYCAQQRIEELKEEYHDLNKSALKLAQEVKQSGKKYTPAICDLISREFKSVVWNKKQILVKAQALTEKPYLIEDWN